VYKLIKNKRSSWGSCSSYTPYHVAVGWQQKTLRNYFDGSALSIVLFRSSTKHLG